METATHAQRVQMVEKFENHFSCALLDVRQRLDEAEEGGSGGARLMVLRETCDQAVSLAQVRVHAFAAPEAKTHAPRPSLHPPSPA